MQYFKIVLVFNALSMYIVILKKETTVKAFLTVKQNCKRMKKGYRVFFSFLNACKFSCADAFQNDRQYLFQDFLIAEFKFWVPTNCCVLILLLFVHHNINAS